MKDKSRALNKTVTIIGIVLCVVFGALLIMNLTIIIKGLVNPDWPPSVFGRTPMVVKSGSMSSDVTHLVEGSEILDLSSEQIAALKPGDSFKTKNCDYIENNIVETIGTRDDGTVIITSTRPAADHIEIDDLIFAKTTDTNALEVGQIITFMERDQKGQRTGSVITHRIIEIVEESGERMYRTKGDANNSNDIDPVKQEDIVGVFAKRIPKIGAFIFFLQKPWGMVIFIGLPVILFIIYDIIRRQRAAKKDSGKVEELEKELERLRALEAEKNAQKNDGGQSGEAPDAAPEEEKPDSEKTE